ncbi:MAG TPA: hypothetical protein VFB22_14190 [Candidatus Baltobacteraceae bacterium]|nr:hypothetical protein [Candidatus Baltobacteraceae bacterium]
MSAASRGAGTRPARTTPNGNGRAQSAPPPHPFDVPPPQAPDAAPATPPAVDALSPALDDNY